MKKIYFSSDYHFGHANIIIYCKRPQFREADMRYDEKRKRVVYASRRIAIRRCKEMEKMIIENHNRRVKKDDVVFHIGDFCFKNSSGGKNGEGNKYNAVHYKNKLNGDIVFIRGNHDKNNSCKTIIENIQIYFGGKRMNLVHEPDRANMDVEINLVGHVHDKWKVKRIVRGNKITDCINVGLDVWNYKPVTIQEIFSRYSQFLRLVKQGKINKTY